MLFIVVAVFMIATIDGKTGLGSKVSKVTTKGSTVVKLALKVLTCMSDRVRCTNCLGVVCVPNSRRLMVFVYTFVNTLVNFL